MKEEYKDFDGMVCIDCYCLEMITEEFARQELCKMLWADEKKYNKNLDIRRIHDEANDQRARKENA